MILTAEEREQLVRAIEMRQRIEALRAARPSDWYDPHENGQRQFHETSRPIRLLFPGNGWGKTTAIGAEIDAWVMASQRWRATPRRPVACVWFCPQFKQFDMLREQLESTCFSGGWTFNAQDNVYRWPNGSKLYVCSADRSWTHLQGIPADLIVFDEEPPIMLWREMLMRRRGKKRTEFCIAATATRTASWMESLWSDWRDWHAARGLTERDAEREQAHPDIWCWAHGGILDNPSMDQRDFDWYDSRKWGSEAEKRVRMAGGFARMTGNTVFAAEALEAMRARMEELNAGRAGVRGMIVAGGVR